MSATATGIKGLVAGVGIALAATVLAPAVAATPAYASTATASVSTTKFVTTAAEKKATASLKTLLSSRLRTASAHYRIAKTDLPVLPATMSTKLTADATRANARIAFLSRKVVAAKRLSEAKALTTRVNSELKAAAAARTTTHSAANSVRASIVASAAREAANNALRAGTITPAEYTAASNSASVADTAANTAVAQAEAKVTGVTTTATTDPTLGYDGSTTLPVASALGTVRLWDTQTTWCDVQPTADITGAALDARFAAAYGPLLDNAAANGVARVIVVVGHPAPWVYGTPAANAPTTTTGMWYCKAPAGGFYTSANMLPSSAAFADTTSVSRTAFTKYSRALMTYIDAHYAGRFETSFQASNELNVALKIDASVDGTATSGTDAGRALAKQDAVLKSLTAGFPTSNFTVMSSSLASGSYATGGVYRGSAASVNSRFTYDYLNALDNSASASVDYLAFNSYSEGITLTAPASLTTDQLSTLTSSWWDEASGLIDAIKGDVVTTRGATGSAAGFTHRLPSLPMVQTETNQNLVNNKSGCATSTTEPCDLTNTYLTDADRVYLAQRMVADGHLMGFASQVVYRWDANPMQVAVRLSADSAAFQALNAMANPSGH